MFVAPNESHFCDDAKQNDSWLICRILLLIQRKRISKWSLSGIIEILIQVSFPFGIFNCQNCSNKSLFKITRCCRPFSFFRCCIEFVHICVVACYHYVIGEEKKTLRHSHKHCEYSNEFFSFVWFLLPYFVSFWVSVAHLLDAPHNGRFLVVCMAYFFRIFMFHIPLLFGLKCVDTKRFSNGPITD